jgi:CRP-like cAMP-binding protein
VIKLSSNVSDVFPKVLKLSSEVDECKPLLTGRVSVHVAASSSPPPAAPDADADAAAPAECGSAMAAAGAAAYGACLKYLGTGESFGERGLLNGATPAPAPPGEEPTAGFRTASVLTATDCEMLRLPRELFLGVVAGAYTRSR